MKKNLEVIIEEIVIKIMDEYGFEMVDVEYVKEVGEYYLRVYIDKEEGIFLNECELVSRELSLILDEKDFIKENYFLEVFFLGFDRVLKKDRDFVRY